MKQFNLDEYLANPSRKVVTRDGRAVKIHCTNFGDIQPIIAEIEGRSSSDSFTKDGNYYIHIEESRNDLFFVSEKHEGWVNVYRSLAHNETYCDRIYDSEEEAKFSTNNSIATVKIEWEE